VKFGSRGFAQGKSEEVSILIATLHASEQRLEEITGGEVDTVADRDGRTFLMQRAQNHQRQSEAEKQAAILNALPAQIALLDRHGFVVSVNDAWSRLDGANARAGEGSGVGINYLETCEAARGEGAEEAHAAARGIRSVLVGQSKSFSIEFSCPSPAGAHCFGMTVTPLSEDYLNGAVVMRLDVTERKRAEGILRESERRFSGLLGSIQMASVMLDREARITYCNEYLLRLTGWRLEEVLGQDWFQTFMPAELGDMKPVFAQLLDNLPDAWHREQEIYTRSGERRLLRWNNSVLRSGDGAVVGTASIGEDITEHRRNQEALRQNEERTRSIVESALDAVVVTDASGRITDWNPQAERTFGWSPQEAIGRLLAETIIPVAYREDHARGMRRFVETGVGPILSKPLEISALHRDGRRIPVELAITPVKLAGGWIFSAFIRDLTDRKRGEHELRRFVAAIDATSDAICMVDRATMSFVHVNDAACRMHGLTRAELMKRQPGSVMLSVPVAELARTYDEIIASRVPAAPLEFPSRRDDGTPRWLELRRHAQRSGEHWMIVSVLRDITKRKAAETRIRRLNRLYAVLSGINTLIVRVGDREELFREACRICVEAGAFRTAWIGTVDPVTLSGTIAACHGDEGGFADASWLIACDEGPHADLPACRALRESRPVICNDVASDPALTAVRGRMLDRGYKSLACFPLKMSGRPEAVLALFSGKPASSTRRRHACSRNWRATSRTPSPHRKEGAARLPRLLRRAHRTCQPEPLLRAGRDIPAGRSQRRAQAGALPDRPRAVQERERLARPARRRRAPQAGGRMADRQPGRRQPPCAGRDGPVRPGDAGSRAGGRRGPAPRQDDGGPRAPHVSVGDAELRIAAKIGVAVFPVDGGNAEILLAHAESALEKAKASGDRTSSTRSR
jgi:PAS domain S-box-containing protein